MSATHACCGTRSHPCKQYCVACLCRRSGGSGTEQGAVCGTSFVQFTEDSNILRTICNDDNCCSYIPTIKRFFPAFVDQHISEQAHCVFLPDGKSMVDYIGSTESIHHDWAIILDEINRRAGTDFQSALVPFANPNGRRADGHDLFLAQECKLPRLQAMFNQTTLRNIAMQYAMDVVRFGFM